MANLKKTLAQNLAKWRESHDWTQFDLAAATDLSVDAIRGYEQQKKWPNAERLQNLATALGTSPDVLLSLPGTDKTTSPPPTVKALLGVIQDQERRINQLESTLAASTRPSIAPDLRARLAAADAEIARLKAASNEVQKTEVAGPRLSVAPLEIPFASRILALDATGLKGLEFFLPTVERATKERQEKQKASHAPSTTLRKKI